MADREEDLQEAREEETPVPLPSAPLIQLARNATLQPPLTRRGHGPGLVIIAPEDPPLDESREEVTPDEADYWVRRRRTVRALNPPPQKKWAEEGYAVVRLCYGEQTSTGDGEQGVGVGAQEWGVETALGKAVEALIELETCDTKDRFGMIVYGTPENYPSGFTNSLKAAYEAESRLIASVHFSADWDFSPRPELVHIAGPSPSSSSSAASPPAAHSHSNSQPPTSRRVHYYPVAQSARFTEPSSPSNSFYHHSSSSISHTRSVGFLRPHLGGPYFDLEAIWDEHTAYEFAERSVAQTMGTMVDEPYVNHVPTLTGGVGRKELTAFYRERFIFSNPPDAALELVSRTVGVDRVVDEFVFSLTHDRMVHWLLPGIPPTHQRLRIPFVAVVNIRGDRLCHEHIHWDQGTALKQAGLMPGYLPFPYALPDGRVPSAPHRRFDYHVPVGGGNTANMLENPGIHGSNVMCLAGVPERNDTEL